MDIKVKDELPHLLGEIDERIKGLENSPNRTFVLIDYETLTSFHWFNICFKQFWDEFDPHNASQLFLYQKISDTYSDLCDRYASLFKEQIDYLQNVLDYEHKSVKDLAPIIFNEDNSTDVIGYYNDCLKDQKDNEGNPLYKIDLDSNPIPMIVDRDIVHIVFNVFHSDRLNYEHYRSLFGMKNCLQSIYSLMCVVTSYPHVLLSDYKPCIEDKICALELGLLNYAKEVEKDVERDLKNTAQKLKTCRNSTVDPNVWGKVMEAEDELFDLAISGKLDENEENRLEFITASRDQLTDNYALLQKIKITSYDEELFDIKLSVIVHQLLSSLNADNLDLFYELVLRRNIIHREMFPGKLGPKYEEWLNKTEEQQPEEDEVTGLSNARQSKLDEIISILQNGEWKQPATADNIELLLNTLFGKDTSLIDEGDISKCEKMWALVEGGGGDRMMIVPANLAGFFKEENLLKGTPKEISTVLFSNSNQVNNINKGKSGYRSNAFEEVIPFIKKYIDKIIRQV